MALDRCSQARGTALALVVLAGVVTLDVLFGSRLVISGFYGVAALLMGATGTVRRTLAVALGAGALAVLSGTWNGNLLTQEWATRLVLTVVLGALGLFTARLRAERERDLREMTAIAETAQRAVLRALPTAVGQVRLAARYVSATRAALVGGDLYEVADSPFGIRVIVGDVRGKGLAAVQMAGTVLEAFRRRAFSEASLPALAAHLDQVVASVAGEEDFVTAVLVELHEDHTVTLVNCGHYPPLVVASHDGFRVLPTGEPQLPLGLGSTPHQVTSPLPADCRMLIYTDGLVETRDRGGVFFPLCRYVEALRDGSLEQALDQLIERLVEYAGHQVTDDLALVLVGVPDTESAPAAAAEA